jgi:transcriptional regulator with XRE-family HTH domain
MSRSETPVGPVATIAQRVKELRGRRGWTAAHLGKELGRHGISWDRFTVANLESGKRQNVTVQELYALALALDVSPTNLLVPLDDRPYQITPTRAENADMVRAWVRGEEPLPGSDERTYRAEVSLADMRKAHTGTLDEQAQLLARVKGLSLSDAYREIADRLEQEGGGRG